MYIVVNIGCLECGVTSDVVGIFADKSKAYDIATQCERNFYFREGGQNAFDVFELPEPETINKNYELKLQGDLL